MGTVPCRGRVQVFPAPTTAMYRAILPTGDIACERYERQDQGVEVYNEFGEMIAFVPYQNLVALVDEEATVEEDRSAM